MWTLIVITVVCGFGPVCAPVSHSAITTTSSKEECEEARSELLKSPGYVPEYVKCLPGKGIN